MQIEYKYPVILHSYLDNWSFCTVKKHLLNQSAVRTTLLQPLSFSCLMRNELKDLAEKKSSWIINNLLDVWCVVSLSIFTHGAAHKNACTQRCYTTKRPIRYMYFRGCAVF